MMYARNVTAFLTHLIKDQKLNLNLEDEIVRETLLTRGRRDCAGAGPGVFCFARAGKRELMWTSPAFEVRELWHR
jgi:hypothetical protein